MDKDLACDIHVVNLRTMLKTQYKLEPSENSALILHRQGFNSCYKPVGHTCSTNEGKVRDSNFTVHALGSVAIKVIFGPMWTLFYLVMS